jgi:hypothetical protein
MRCWQSLGLYPSTKNQPWDYNMGICSLKIGWDVARAFLMEFALIVLSLDFSYCPAVTATPTLAVLYIHNFGYFLLSFTVLKREFLWLYVIFFSP